MTPGEFQRYLKPAIRSYAKMHIRAGDVDPKKALGRAKAEYAELLPKGLASAGHHLYAITLLEDGRTLGMVWFELKQRHGKRKAFIFDFAIDKARRGKGFATQAMSLIEQQAKVLYEKCGYRYLGMQMSKDLD